MIIVPQKDFPSDHPVLKHVYAQILPARGYDVTWLMFCASGVPREARWEGTRVLTFHSSHSSAISGRLAHRIAWIRLLLRAARLMSTERPNIIQVRNGVESAIVCWLLSRLTGSAFVYQFSFPDAEKLVLAAKDGRVRMARLRRILGRPRLAARNRVMRRADLVLAISEELRRQLIEAGVAAGRVVAFPLGTECPPMPPEHIVDALREELDLANRQVVAYMGVIAPERQLDFLIRVAALVRVGHPKASWLIVGSDSDGESERLRAVAARAGVSDVVKILGPVARAQVPAYLALADVAVSPIPVNRLFVVSSPTKTVEALAMGVPVVATDIPDHIEVVGASGGGLIVPFNDRLFAEAVMRLLDDPELAAHMGRAGQEYVRRVRSYDVLADVVDVRYRALVSAQSGRNRK